MPKIKRPTIIYWLLDVRPETIAAGWNSGKPFYCGKTIRAEKKRFMEHMNEAKRRPDREHSKRILECGVHITLHVVETVAPSDDWIKRERHWIAYLRSYFPGGTNIADGGEGGACGGRPKLGVKVKMLLLGIPANSLKQLRDLKIKNISKFIREAVEEKILLDRSQD